MRTGRDHLLSFVIVACIFGCILIGMLLSFFSIKEEAPTLIMNGQPHDQISKTVDVRRESEITRGPNTNFAPDARVAPGGPPARLFA